MVGIDRETNAFVHSILSLQVEQAGGVFSLEAAEKDLFSIDSVSVYICHVTNTATHAPRVSLPY